VTAPVTCPACARTDSRPWTVVRNTHGEYPVRKCRSCRSAFVWPRPASEVLGAFYRGPEYKRVTVDEFQESERTYHPSNSMDAARIVAASLRLSGGGRFLDIGAGFGEFSRAAMDAGFEVTACEPNANSRAVYAWLNGFEPHSDMFDATFAAARRGQFSVALVNHVLEHIAEPEAFVADLAFVLRPGGLAVVCVPHFGSFLSRLQGKRDMFICPPEHLNFFSARGLRRLLEGRGFEIAALDTVSKLNRRRLLPRFGGGAFAERMVLGLYQGMRLTDSLHMGTVLNAFCVKPAVRPSAGYAVERG
jgi:SAM-dependent methyltransferase